jgi:uncharacterized protein (TIGR03437 family)
MYRNLCACVLLFAIPAFPAAPRAPLGVYAKVDIETAISGYHGPAAPGSPAFHVYMRDLFAGLLANPAMSGLTIGQRWDNIQLAPGTDPSSFDWSYLDDAFAMAAAANKGVKLLLTPGFDAPQWLLAQIPPCDPLFGKKAAAPADCGSITFQGFPEQQRADSNVLPLPWNPVYQAAWDSFLTQVAARYGPNPLFVAISIGGPVGASTEMIFPTDSNDSVTQPSGLDVNKTWEALIQHSFPGNTAYVNNDQAFIDAWKQAIDAYQSIFSGITLILTPDSGDDFPQYPGKVTPHPDNVAFAEDCALSISGVKNNLMSCEAKTEIISHFVASTGPNGKSTLVGGMTALSNLTIGDIGIPGVKLLTGLSPAPSPPILGGAEFDFPVSSPNLQEEGCTVAGGTCPGLSTEEGAYNVLTVFFNATPVGASYGGAAGAAPIMFLEAPYVDVQYSQANPCPAAPSATLGNTSLQDLYNRASHDLFAMANPTAPVAVAIGAPVVPSLPPPTCAANVTTPVISAVKSLEGGFPTITANTWVEIDGQNLSLPNDSRMWTSADVVNGQLPTVLDTVTATVNGKNAFMYAISPTAVRILTPPDAINGPVAIVVSVSGVSGAPFIAPAQAVAPAFVLINGGPYVSAIHVDQSPVGPTGLLPGMSTPAKPGEMVALWATGFGPTVPPVVSGSATQTGFLPALPVITVGGASAKVVFAGLASPGVYEFAILIPPNTATGDNIVIATYQGMSTAALITVNGAGPGPTSLTLYVSPSGSDFWSGRLAAPSADGTDGPLATLDHARALVGAIVENSLNSITVQFRGGTYYLPATVMFTAADSGSAGQKIVYQNYPGETPVFSGGLQIGNWTNTRSNIWKTTLPPSTQYFENLFYNGTRRLRPRLGGYLGQFYRIGSTVYLSAPAPPAAAPNANCSVYVAGSGWECFDRFTYLSTDPISATWENLSPSATNACGQPAGNAAQAGDIELTVWEQFTTSKLPVDCVDTVNHIVYLTGPTAISQTNYTQQGFITGNRYLIENVQDQLTQPGQWFLDRSNSPWTLTYVAQPGENPNTDMVIIPQLPQLLIASNLSNVTFQGLTFEHDNFTVPAAGYVSSELEPSVSAAVSFQNSRNIVFDSGTVTQTSGVGLEIISCLNNFSPAWCAANNINANTSNDTIQNSAFYDLGTLGIRIGNPRVNADTDANEPQSITVQNNVVEGYGRVIPASFGIGQGEGHDNLYTHNDVYDGYHCAISISESAGDATPPTGKGNFNNTISFNHVYNLLQGIMNDGGSIRIEAGNQAYTAPGNKILNNKIHDVTDASIQDSNGYGGNGIYLDNQTGLVDVENNLVYRVSDTAMYSPQGPASPNEASTIKNNIFAFARKALVAVNLPYKDAVPTTAVKVYNITNNILYFDRNSTSQQMFWPMGGCTYSNGFPYVQFQFWNSNLYWRTDGTFASDAQGFDVQTKAGNGSGLCSNKLSTYTFYNFTGWQGLGEDVQSVVLNPAFTAPLYPKDDFTMVKGSPGVGFVVFDPSQAGRTSPLLQPPAVLPTFPTKTYNPLTDY